MTDPVKKLDQKFYGKLFKVKDNSVVPDDQYVVFLAKDNAFYHTLPTYLYWCKSLGCDEEQIAAVERLISNISTWRLANPDKCKTPDAKGERLLEGSGIMSDV